MLLVLFAPEDTTETSTTETADSNESALISIFNSEVGVGSDISSILGEIPSLDSFLSEDETSVLSSLSSSELVTSVDDLGTDVVLGADDSMAVTENQAVSAGVSQGETSSVIDNADILKLPQHYTLIEIAVSLQ